MVLSMYFLREKKARPLINLDIPGNNEDTPYALQFPRGDFDGDGKTDIAISGAFEEGEKKGRYFLLVVPESEKLSDKKILYLETGLAPFLLHDAGTTGEHAPPPELFSVTFCTACEQGFDYSWNPSEKKISKNPWEKRKIVTQKIVSIPEDPVPDDDINLSLKIVGSLPDVIAFVKACEEKKIPLQTRVIGREKKENKWVSTTVRIATKNEKGETLYDEIIVDLSRKSVLARTKRGKKL